MLDFSWQYLLSPLNFPSPFPAAGGVFVPVHLRRHLKKANEIRVLWKAQQIPVTASPTLSDECLKTR